RVIWSAAGREAVLGRTYRRFSPQWEIDPETFEPLEISANLGGLVNRAAFRNIAPVIARDASKTKTNMDTIEMSEAIAEALRPIESRIAALETKPATAAGGGNINNPVDAAIARAVDAAMKSHTDALAELQTNTMRAQARAAIQPHIDRGAIPPLAA